MNTTKFEVCGRLRLRSYFGSSATTDNKIEDPIKKINNSIKFKKESSITKSDKESEEICCKNVMPNVRKFNDIPGPRSLPIFGTLWAYLPIIGKYSFNKLYSNFRKNYEEYGAIVREEMIPGVNLVYLADAGDIEALLRSCGRFPERRSHVAMGLFREGRPDKYNNGGLLATNGPEWWKIRSLFQKPLSSPQKASLYIGQTDLVVGEFIERIKLMYEPREGSDEVRDFLEHLSRLNLQLICIIAFDIKIDSFSDEEMLPGSITSKLIEATLASNSNIFQTDNEPIFFRKIKSPAVKRLHKALEYLEQIALEFILKKKKNLEEGECIKSPAKELSLLETYLMDPEIDIKDIIGMSVDLLLAGIDTTSYTTSFVLYHLAKNPKVQNKLFEEAVGLLPKSGDSVTANVLNKSFYCKAVLKESLRMNPVSVGIGRNVTKDVVLSGYNIPKGAIAVTSNQVTSNLERYFDRPGEFIPERWSRGSDQYRPPNPFASIPFGHGSRMCIARRLAEQNMYITLLKLVRNFEIGWKGGDLDIVSAVINKPDGPVNLTFKPRIDRLGL